MVLTARRTALTPALIVPDEQTWTMSGADPAAWGLRPVFAPGDAERLLIPDALPDPIAEALRSRRRSLPEDVEVEKLPLEGLDGEPVGAPTGLPSDAHAAVRGENRGHARHSGVSEHAMLGSDHQAHDGGHAMHGDHADMMAIVGEPSADGLVMEPVELTFGPLATPLPGGLTVDVTLDGDVVADSVVHAQLVAGRSAHVSPSPPDLLAPVAWTIAIEAAGGDGDGPPWRRLAALEAERAVSHLAWLRALGRLLGWRLLIDRCTAALEDLPPLAHTLTASRNGTREQVMPALERAAARAEGVARVVRRSRLLQLRTAGLGHLPSEHVERLGLRGPLARASGLHDDVRAGSALYNRLGFEPVRRRGGDARARILVRAAEASESLRLALGAVRADADGLRAKAPLATAGHEVEGPRGPVRAERGADGWRLSAPGAEESLEAAGEAMVGAEWSAALVALASFDLSPWRVAA